MLLEMIDEHLDAEFGTENRRPKHLFVAVYLDDRAYGGPEEGGWWYDCGQLVRVMRLFRNEQQAISYCRRLNARLGATFNRDRRDIGSMLSEGIFRAHIYDTLPPEHYPVTRPFYS